MSWRSHVFWKHYEISTRLSDAYETELKCKVQKVHSWTDQREELSVLSDTCEPDDGASLKVLSLQPPLLLAMG